MEKMTPKHKTSILNAINRLEKNYRRFDSKAKPGLFESNLKGCPLCIAQSILFSNDPLTIS